MRIEQTSLLALAFAICFSGADWTQFRGSDNRSVADGETLPVQLDLEKHVAWKVPLPGRGASSPIVVDGRVLVTCSSDTRRDRLHLLCFDGASGELCWARQLWATGRTSIHPFGAVAAPTPASDGQRVFALYSSNDLACFDLDGNLQWLRGLTFENPTTRNDVGMGSSPLVIGRSVIVQLQNQGESFVAALDTATGQTQWRIQRERDALWASPTVLRGKTPQEDILLLQDRKELSGWDPQRGEKLWAYEASCHTTASATTWDGKVYLPAEGLHALQYDSARRQVELLWREPRLRSENASPVVHDGRVYTIKAPAILVCGDAADGKILWQLRLKGPQWGTPVLAGGHLYCVNHEGLIQIVELGEKGRIVSTGQIDQEILASPAVADGAMYLRSQGHLWKIASD